MVSNIIIGERIGSLAVSAVAIFIGWTLGKSTLNHYKEKKIKWYQKKE